MNPCELGADPAGARSAIAALAAVLRVGGYDLAGGTEAVRRDPLFALAMSVPVDLADARRCVDPSLVDRLLEHDLATVVDGQFVLGFAMFAAGGTYAVVPPHDRDGARVYLGGDVRYVLDAVWRRAPGGDRAVDLGTGTGFLAAALARRYRSVVATDLSARCTATADLTRLVNPDVSDRIAVVQADVAGPLRAGCADLVVANPPWVAHADLDETGQPCVYADGGPTGFELPSRFLVEGAALLAPGGVAVVTCLDLEHADGHAPLAVLADGLRADGFEVDVVPTGANDEHGFIERHHARQPTLRSLRHVAAIVHRLG